MDILFSSTHIFIPEGCSVIKLAIKKRFHKLFVLFESVKLKSNDKKLIYMIEKMCVEDPTNSSLLKKVSNELIFSKELSLFDCEYLVKYLNFIESFNFNEDRVFEIEIYDHKYRLHPFQILRIYNFLNAFCKNYPLMDMISRFYYSAAEFSEEITEKINKTKKNKFIEQEEIKNDKNPAENNIILENSNEKIDENDLLSLIITQIQPPVIRNYLISHIFNYLFYLRDLPEIQKKENEVLIKIPNLISKISDIQFLEEIYLNRDKIKKSENFNFILLNLLNLIVSNVPKIEKEKIYILILSFCILIYTILIIIEKNKDPKFEKILREEVQEKIFGNAIRITNFKNLAFRVFPIQLNLYQLENLDEINSIFEKYKYLKTIPDNFLEMIFQEKNKNKNYSAEFLNNFQLTPKKIFNVENLIKNNIEDVQINFLDEFCGRNLLSYSSKYGKNIISYPFLKFLEYCENNEILINILNDEKIECLEVRKLFPVLKNTIIEENFERENNNTFEYFKILTQKIPSLKDLDFRITLFIIFQLIIPFYYFKYQATIFIDLFL